MIAVIFEVIPRKDKTDTYLNMAAELGFLLEGIDGFISIERFASLTQQSKILSLSFWRDEQAIAKWRNIEAHRFAQQKGRSDVFHDYRLRIADVSRDYSMHNREQVPLDSAQFHD